MYNSLFFDCQVLWIMAEKVAGAAGCATWGNWLEEERRNQGDHDQVGPPDPPQ